MAGGQDIDRLVLEIYQTQLSPSTLNFFNGSRLGKSGTQMYSSKTLDKI